MAALVSKTVRPFPPTRMVVVTVAFLTATARLSRFSLESSMTVMQMAGIARRMTPRTMKMVIISLNGL